jgi:hypothetical protein
MVHFDGAAEFTWLFARLGNLRQRFEDRSSAFIKRNDPDCGFDGGTQAKDSALELRERCEKR